MGVNIFMVAGEASADQAATALLGELKKTNPDLTCFGVGGDRLADAGMELIAPARDLNVVGISDWFDSVPTVLKTFRKVVRTARERKPDLAILLDLPDFNLLLAKRLKSLGILVVYYISPQVWAWRKYRLRKIQKRVDRMLVLFPFEQQFYEDNGVEARFVGHPLLESLQPRENYREAVSIEEAPRIALLPGSRRSEIRYHAPILRELVIKLRERYPQCELVIPIASTLDPKPVKEAFENCPVKFRTGQAIETLKECDVAVVASGTVSLETALVGTPFCLFYQVSPSSAWIFRTVSRYSGYIGMPNVLLKEERFREFFQEKATSENLFQECVRLIEDANYRSESISSSKECRDLLGGPGASERAAREVNAMIEGLR